MEGSLEPQMVTMLERALAPKVPFAWFTPTKPTGRSAFSVETYENVAQVRLTGPGKDDAMGPDFWRELPEIFRELDADRGCARLCFGPHGKGHRLDGDDDGAISDRSVRERILIAAAELFRERGVEATSIRDVIVRADAHRSSIYYHFPHGKAQLAAEAVRRAGSLMTSAIRVDTAATGPIQVVAFIIDLFRRHLQVTGFAAGCPIAAGALAGAEFPGSGEVFDSWRSLLTETLCWHGVEQTAAQPLATTMISAIEGAILVSRAQQTITPLDDVESVLTAWLTTTAGR
ncbi:TetR family transcriptional regulator [Nocardia beijingensis]|uniref:TetR/AcrR family transcriptional regulator n=1 Tax=Nocardia beijingensis TaxID=95162 RepID=UPI0033331687